MRDFEWSDKMGHRERNAFCLLVSGGQIHRLVGDHIPGVVAVVSKDYRKNGKWSEFVFRCKISDNVRVFHGHWGWETGRFLEGLAASKNESYRDHRSGRRSPTPTTWQELADFLGVSRDIAEKFLRSFNRRESEELDAAEKAVAGLI